jgi:hypothetical protein
MIHPHKTLPFEISFIKTLYGRGFHKIKVVPMKILHILLLVIMVSALTVSPNLAQDPIPSAVTAIDWSSDASRFAVATLTNLTIYDDQNQVISMQSFPDGNAFQISDLIFSPSGEQIYIGRTPWEEWMAHAVVIDSYCNQQGVDSLCIENGIFNTDTLQLIADLSGHSFQSNAGQWSSDETQIAFRNREDRATDIYSAVDGSLLRSFSSDAFPMIWSVGYDGFDTVEWSPNNQYFARPAEDTLYILDAFNGEIVFQYQYEINDIIDLNWSPDSTKIAILTRSSILEHIIVNVGSGEVITHIASGGIAELFTIPTWSPDGTELATTSGLGRINIWDTVTGNLIDSFQVSPNRVRKLGFSAYGGRLIIGNWPSEPQREADPAFVPLTVYAQSSADQLFQFVAPDASPDRLKTILDRCIIDTMILAQGLSLIDQGQYASLSAWIDQQPESLIPPLCVEDLDLMVSTMLR